jgi:hypothetical protein
MFLCYESPFEVVWLEWQNAMRKRSAFSEVILKEDLIHDQWRSYVMWRPESVTAMVPP